MKHLLPTIRSYFILTLLLGLAYPLMITGLGQVFFSNQANGNLISSNGKVIGSSLLAQKFENSRYFWPRPSAVDYNSLPSGGSNLGPTSQTLKELSQARSAKLGLGAPPSLYSASASGLDPHIDFESASFQIARIAQERGVPEEVIRSKVESQSRKRDLGFLGEETINVLKLNLALDEKL